MSVRLMTDLSVSVMIMSEDAVHHAPQVVAERHFSTAEGSRASYQLFGEKR